MKISNRPNKRKRKNNILNRENVPDTLQIVFLSFYIFQFIEDILTGSVILSVKLGERSGTEKIKINEYKGQVFVREKLISLSHLPLIYFIFPLVFHRPPTNSQIISHSLILYFILSFSLPFGVPSWCFYLSVRFSKHMFLSFFSLYICFLFLLSQSLCLNPIPPSLPPFANLISSTTLISSVTLYIYKLQPLTSSSYQPLINH